MNKDEDVSLTIKLAAEDAIKEVNKMANSIDGVKYSVRDLGKEIKKTFNQSTIIGFAKAMSDLLDNMIRLSTPQAKFIENLNLMEVAFDKNSDSAYKLLDSMNDVFGLDPSNMAKQVGTYRQMASAMDISSDTAALLSENLLKLQDDVSSLYNLDTDKVFTKFQSAMAGQSRAVRSLGVDITTTGLQNELYRRGINATVDSLDSASKEILIYLTMEYQLRNAQGDLAKTSESVANQIRIFKEEVGMLARQIGAFLIPVLQTVLPILNGIIMALNTILSMILGFFHIDAKGLASQFGIAEVNTGFDKLGKTLNNTSKTAKEAKKSLRGFDKLNAIYTPTNSSGGNVSAGGGGGLGNADVYNKLKDQLKEYNNKMKDVQTKATKIRDAILEALGFTKDLNGQWKFTHLTIWGVLAILAGVGGVIWAIATVYKTIKKIAGIGKALGMGKNILKKKDINDTIDTINGAGDVGDAVNENSNSFALPSFKTVLKGIAELALIIGALTAIVAAIGALCKFKGFKEALQGGISQIKDLAIMLAIAIVPMGLFSAGVVVLGKVKIGTVLKGIMAFGALITGLEAIVGAVGIIADLSGTKDCINGGIETVERLATMLTKTMIPLGLFCAGVIALGALAEPALKGLGIFAALIFGLTGVVTALGALQKIDGFTDLVNGGGEVLFKLADILGGFFGTIISSFVDKATDFLPDLGTKLSQFAENLTGFVKVSKKIDPNIGNTVKSLADAILAITAEDILNQMTKFITGGKSIEKFGKNLKTFGADFAVYAKEIKDVKGNVVKASANAAESLAEMAHKIPNDGGLAGLLAGNNNLGVWSATLPIFGQNFSKYAKSIAGYNDTTASDKVVEAMKKFVDFAKKIPNEGGAVAWLVGDNGLKQFGSSLEAFGNNFKAYNKHIANINLDKIDKTTSELKKIVDIAKEIKDKGLGSVLGEFSYAASNALAQFTSAFSWRNGNNIGQTFGNAMASAIVKAFKNTTFPTIKLTNTAGELITKAKISVYANGGFPEDGFFFANHNEMVGKFSNGKNVVANNNQIVSGISVGVAKAILSTRRNNEAININVTADDDSIARYLKFRQTQDDRQFGY